MNQQAYTCRPTAGGTLLPYLLALPKDYKQDDGQRWPLLLFLHGRGERGNDLNLIKEYGIPQQVEMWEDTPFIAVSPQCPTDSDWEALTDTLIAFLDELTANYAVDPQRIYLTGLSMGGRGSWRLAVFQPERFAAIAPVCGRIPDLPEFFDRLSWLKHTPIWVFHGAQDPVVPIENSERIVAALRAVDGNVRFTVYPEADHDSWTPTYANPELYSWFLQHSLTGFLPPERNDTT
jgi:predicted peptidase